MSIAITAGLSFPLPIDLCLQQHLWIHAGNNIYPHQPHPDYNFSSPHHIIRLSSAYNRSIPLHPTHHYWRHTMPTSEQQPQPAQHTPRLFDPTEARRRGRFLVNLLYITALVLIGTLILRYLFVWMLPFVFAFLVAMTLQPLLKWLICKTGAGKKFLSVALVILIVLLLAGIVALCAWRLGLLLINFVGDSSNIEQVQTALRDLGAQLGNALSALSDRLSPEAMTTLQGALDTALANLVNMLTDLFRSMATSVLSFVATKLPLLFLGFIVWLLASIFLTIDYDSVMRFLIRQVPKRHIELVAETRLLMHSTFLRLLRAYGLLMLITFGELALGLSLLRVSHALWIAAAIAMVDILPVFGTGTLLIPWAILELASGSPGLFLGLLILYLVITIVRQIVEPRLISRQIGLNPLATLFFMYLGLKTLGLAGMLLFPLGVMVLSGLQKHGRLRLWK